MPKKTHFYTTKWWKLFRVQVYVTQTTTKLLYNETAFFSLRQSINRPTLVYICYYANENIFYSYTGGTSFIYSFSHFTPLNLGYSYILFRVAKNFICFNIFFLFFRFFFVWVFTTPTYLFLSINWGYVGYNCCCRCCYFLVLTSFTNL